MLLLRSGTLAILHLLLLHSVCIGYIVVALSLKLSVLVRRLYEIGFQWVEVARVLQVIDHKLWVFFMDALVIQEVLHLDKVHAHLDHLLSEHFFALAEEVNLLLPATK